jgi:hypothetical protein
MTFIEWSIQEEHSNQNAGNPKTVKARRDRDRLTRMEAMLDDLVLLKRILTEAKTFQTPENSYAKE